MRQSLAALVVMAMTIVPVRASAAGQDQTTEAQIREGLLRSGRGEVAFQDAVRLIELIDRAAQIVSGRDAQARFALYRLRSMKNAAEAIEGPGTPAYARPWVDEHISQLVYSDPAGEWLLNSDVVLQIHDTWSDTVVADDIAWLMVENGWPAECEGDVPCYVRWQNGLHGEYLRRHPRGRHADAANRGIAGAERCHEQLGEVLSGARRVRSQNAMRRVAYRSRSARRGDSGVALASQGASAVRYGSIRAALSTSMNGPAEAGHYVRTAGRTAFLRSHATPPSTAPTSRNALTVTNVVGP